MNAAGRDRWLVAAGVVLMLVVLVVVGRLQGGNLPERDAAVSKRTASTVRLLMRRPLPGNPNRSP